MRRQPMLQMRMHFGLALARYVSMAACTMLALAGCATSTRAQITDVSSQQRQALELFRQHCARAGEFIKRRVSGVEGVRLLKIRPRPTLYESQFADDPYGNDLDGDGYIRSFLGGMYGGQPAGKQAEGDPEPIVLKFVEAVDPKDGVLYRYSGSIRNVERVSTYSGTRFVARDFVLDRIPTQPLAKYAVTYDDISTSTDRELWIAASSLKVIDLETGEIIAERIGFMIDPEQGSRAAGRVPWLRAAGYACPEFKGHSSSHQTGQTQRFVAKVLTSGK